MKIGIAGPISTESVKDLIEGDITKLPEGTQGAPFLGTLIKTLIKKGHHVYAYTLDNTLPPEQLNPISASGQNFKIYYSPCRKYSFKPNGRYPGRLLDFFYREIQALKIAINLDQPDIVHGHWSYEFGLAAIYSHRPYVVTCHDSPLKVFKYIPNYYRFGLLLMALFVFRKAKNLTAVSPYVRGEIARFSKSEISVVPNPTPLETIKISLDNLEDEVDLAVPKIVMLLNGWGPLKNAKPAMQAFNQLLNGNPKATLHIFGYDFQMGGPAQHWAKKNNIDQNVFFHGPTAHPEILSFLNQATMLLHPSLEECCPMTLIEAMSCGLPVVGGENSGGVPWVLGYGKAGLLVDVSKPNEMAEKMNTLLTDKQLYSDCRKKSIQRIQLLFTQEAVAAAYEDIYLKILKGEEQCQNG